MDQIHIIGYGFVGQANAIGFKRLGYDVTAYDIVQKENIYGAKEFEEIPLRIGDTLPESGIHIVCIADKSSVEGTQIISHVAEVLEKLKGKGIVILRTTVLPRIVENLPFDFYWGEFLHERKAIDDFLNPEIIVVGRRDERPFPFEKHFHPVYYCTPREASHIKYVHNIWNSLRIAFVNELGDNMIDEGLQVERILGAYFKGQKYLKWGNAFGGHCLPKDTAAYLKEYPHLMTLEATVKANRAHKKKYPNLDSIY